MLLRVTLLRYRMLLLRALDRGLLSRSLVGIAPYCLAGVLVLGLRRAGQGREFTADEDGQT